jgi:23S rRNA pseudouridine1911/1915/1917 synthase
LEKTLTISSEYDGQRLDVALAAILPDISRTRAQKLIKDSNVAVNGVTVTRPRHRVTAGATVSLFIPEPVELELCPVDITIDIVYEDKDIVVVNKQAGLVVHPGAGNERESLVHALLYHCDDLSGIGGDIRPGIVHRIDKDTSGLIVCAKNDRAHLALSAQFKNRRVKKVYLALVTGHVSDKNGRINAPIGRDPVHRKRMAVSGVNGREAVTDWSVIEQFPFASLLELRIHTGRTHQIRVHMQYIGHPLLGDSLYGGPEQLVLPDKILMLKRQMLHSWKLSFIHPVTSEMMNFSAPVHRDMADVMESLKDV